MRAMVPLDAAAWGGVATGAFIAFFAYIGFETLANMSEEVRDPRRTVPRGILGSIALSVCLYVAFASAVAVSGAWAGASATASFLALVDVTSSPAVEILAAIAFLAVANGVLIQIVTLARLFYGMADEGYLPAALAQLNPRTQTPINATIAVGAIVLMSALLASFEQLLVAANAVTLLLFALVSSALWRIKRRDPAPAGAFIVPAWLPPLAAMTSIALLLTELARRA
jgi:amino acid transporter